MWTGWAHHRSVGLVGGASCDRPVPTSCRGKPASFTKWGGAGGRGQIRREWGPGLGGKTQKSWAWGSEWNASLRTDIWLLRSLQGYLFWVPSPVGDAGACTLPGGSPSPCLYQSPHSTGFYLLPPPPPAPTCCLPHTGNGHASSEARQSQNTPHAGWTLGGGGVKLPTELDFQRVCRFYKAAPSQRVIGSQLCLKVFASVWRKFPESLASHSCLVPRKCHFQLLGTILF